MWLWSLGLLISIKMEKRNLCLIGIVLVLLFQLSFVSCEEGEEVGVEIDVSEMFGLEGVEIVGQGIEVEKFFVGEEEEILAFYAIFVQDNSFLSIKKSLIEEIIFENIVSQEEAKHPTYVEFYRDGGILRADFTVNENGGNYTFEEETFEAPPGSRIYFTEETGLKIKLPEGINVNEFSNLLNLISKGYLKNIRGKNIELPNGINLIDGELEIRKDGFLLKEGVANYKQMKFKTDNILIANPDSDLSDYDGNWIKQTKDVLEIQSAEKEAVQIEFLKDHDILNTDFKDKLIVTTKNGDGLRFEKRKDEGLIPKVMHKSSNKGFTGLTNFQNDKLEITYSKYNSYIDPPEGLLDEDFSKRYQSVAMEIESDSENIKNKIRVNSYRQFAILDRNNNEIVSYNSYGLPVSSKIKDNELQSLAQLREKYEGIELKIASESDLNRVLRKSDLFPEDMEESDFPPYLVYYTNEFFESHPDAVENLKEITYSNYFNAFAKGAGTINIGRLLVDPYESYESEEHKIYLREVENPLYFFQHEYEHILDHQITNKEFQFIKKLNGPEIKEFFDEAWYTDKNKINSISKKYYEKYPNGMLQQCYNEVALEAVKKLNYPKLKEYVGEDGYVSLLTGIPYEYALHNSADSQDISLARYSELSSTYREQPIETRKLRANSANPRVSNMYKKLTQLAFDSEKMGVDEYKEIIGNICERNDCLDKRCVEYKLLCCESFPDSPNC